MISSPSLGLIPLNGCILIKLGKQYENFSTVEGKYETRTNGIVVAVQEDEPQDEYLVGKRIYFEEYKEGARIKRDGELYCFIKAEDVRGYEQ